MCAGIVCLPPAGSEEPAQSSVMSERSSGVSRELKVLDTEAFGQQLRPQGPVNIAPNSVELISLPLIKSVGEQHSLVLSLMGSRWTAPIPLLAEFGGPEAGYV